MKDLRVIFMGTPDFAVPVLNMLIDNTNVIMVVTQPDKEVGRNHEVRFSPIKERALKSNIPVFQPIKLKDDYEEIIKMNADIIVTCAFGQIVPEVILSQPRLGCINVHASLLPYLRGGAPIHHALIDGYDKTGITIMYMDKGLDTGDIISQEELPILDSDNVGTLHDKLSDMGASLLKETLPSIVSGTNNRIKQDDSLSTFAHNISREEEHLDFNRSAREVFNHIRGLNPFPTSYAIINNEEVKVLEAYIGENSSTLSPGTICDIKKDALGVSTKDKVIYITKVKPFGKRAMDARDYINGLNKEEVINTIVV